MIRIRAIAAAGVLALLAACSSSHAAGSTSSGPSAIQTEGSIKTHEGSFVRYPDGVVVRLVNMQRLGNYESGYSDNNGQLRPLPADQALIKATISIDNGSKVAIPLDSGTLLLTVLYGVNRQEADQDAGTTDTSADLTSNDPTQVAAGQTIYSFVSYDVPADQLGDLSVTSNLRPLHYTPYTFTDAQTILKGSG